MSYERGMAALHLEMTDRVPRTEYSAECHWDLIEAVTGIAVSEDSPEEVQAEASDAFVNAWDYDFMWAASIGSNVFGEVRTKMGHAVYAAGGVDYSDEIGSPFLEPEDALDFDPDEQLPGWEDP